MIITTGISIITRWNIHGVYFGFYDPTVIVCSAWFVNEVSELLIYNVYYFTVNTCTFNVHIIMEQMNNQEFYKQISLGSYLQSFKELLC